MFEYKNNIYCIGIFNENNEVIQKLSPKNIEIIHSSTIEISKLTDADYIVAQMEMSDIKNLISMMNDLNKSLNNLVLCLSKEDMKTIFDCEQVYDIGYIWHKDSDKKELIYNFKKLLDKIAEDNEVYEYRKIIETVINTSVDLIWVKDIKGRHKMFNNNFLDALPPAKDGHKKTYDECVDRGHLFLWELSPEDYSGGEFICMESELDVIEANRTLTFDEKLIVGNGDIRKLITKKSPVHDRAGNIIGTVGVAKDITQELLYKEMLEKNANTDYLTGIFNRRYMYDLMEANIYNEFAVLFMDLDNFKYINDTYGHNKGDEAIVLTAETLQQILPDFLVGRLGGDEFIVFMEGKHDLQEIVSTVKSKIKEAYSKDTCFQTLDISIGYAENNTQNPDIEHLIHIADNIMYDSKILQKK
ncbi:diguanylate cyclase (GGDEF) domain-containing protein [Peptoanaerobacter stomatis]|uniref:Diguanylate cyclase (GGDEF) domain protein n=1 Tax=Peptoanaerobacter stomatis TaxID=796937 RepID=J6HMB0_9FIRM|nr:sensor domain-containing diguanylate cyclase [Peptoanaerobacter stomatis]EHL15342.1 diguanylate cyclase (GGDEF) domain-containing protein [Peptoanaerobacter stomatis]EJU23563.1 diguanylate cyclase (GGDEF) domain protein [Peptoanaerobacter stomatis]NWO24539.1 sensor domain-containing diguanylate cyclase [Peptostreptococcaceae bacterium oral taxon 081]